PRARVKPEATIRGHTAISQPGAVFLSSRRPPPSLYTRPDRFDHRWARRQGASDARPGTRSPTARRSRSLGLEIGRPPSSAGTTPVPALPHRLLLADLAQIRGLAWPVPAHNQKLRSAAPRERVRGRSTAALRPRSAGIGLGRIQHRGPPYRRELRPRGPTQ